jgi:predicted HNH restriction endonuclease
MNKCLNCQKETNNPKFCSRSCAATYNNKKYPKRTPNKKCARCNNLITYNLKYCNDCKFKQGEDITLSKAIYHCHHKSSAFALVRSRARKIARDLNLNICQNCGYNKHVEICHRKPIADFDESTMLSVINHPDNLIALCPNCHWEFDHNQLDF